jgi:hypothetical protein
MAINTGVCEKEYGERLIKIVEKAIGLAPKAMVDFSNIKEDAKKAKSDKKNTDDGQIKMAVAKAKDEWTMLALPFESYQTMLVNLTKK